MKICYIANGESLHTKRWVEWFVKRGQQVFLITSGASNVKGIEEEYIFPFKVKGGYIPRPSFIIKIKQIIKRMKPDIVHAHYLIPFGMYGALTNYHPFVTTIWGSDISLIPEISILHKNIVKYALKKSDLIHTLDHYQKELCIRLGVPKGKIAVLYNYVDTNVFSPDKRSQQLREKLEIGNDTAIICLRGFEPHYDIRTFIEAIPHVLKEEPDAKFLLMGEQGSEKEKENIINLTKKLGITSNMNFVGQINLVELPTYLASCDIHVDPLRYGSGVGHGNMQVMSSGLARVAADRKGVEETVKDGETGYLYKGGDPKDLADKIILLMENEKLRKVFGARCREFVENINRTGRNEIGIEKYYEELIEKHKK